MIDADDDGTIEVSRRALTRVASKWAAWNRYTVSQVADEFATFAQGVASSGRYYKPDTGMTSNSIAPYVYKKARNRWGSVHYIRPGVKSLNGMVSYHGKLITSARGEHIDGMLNYINGWSMPKKRFMMDAAASFGLEKRVVAALQENTAKMMIKEFRANA